MDGQTEHHAVKAYYALGNTDNLYEESYSSLEHGAPLKLLKLDTTLCGEMYTGEITAFSAQHLVGATVLVKMESLEATCHFHSLSEWDITALFLALEKAGVKATVLATKHDIPGLLSNLACPQQ